MKNTLLNQKEDIKNIKKALEKYFQDNSSAKEFSICMKESSKWLKERNI